MINTTTNNLNLKNKKYFKKLYNILKLNKILLYNTKLINISYKKNNLWETFDFLYFKKFFLKNLNKQKTVKLINKKNYKIILKTLIQNINIIILKKLQKNFFFKFFNFNKKFKLKKFFLFIKKIILKYSKIKYLFIKNFYFNSINFKNFYYKKFNKNFKNNKYILNFFKLINKNLNKNNKDTFYLDNFKNFDNNKKIINFCQNINIIFLENLTKSINKKKVLKYIFFKKKILNILKITLFNQKLKYLKHYKFILILKNLMKNEILKPNEINDEIFLSRNTILRVLKKKFNLKWYWYRFLKKKNKIIKKKKYISFIKNFLKKKQPIKLNTLLLKNYFKSILFSTANISIFNKNYLDKIILDENDKKNPLHQYNYQLKKIKNLNKNIFIKQKNKYFFFQNFWYKKNIFLYK